VEIVRKNSASCQRGEEEGTRGTKVEGGTRGGFVGECYGNIIKKAKAR